MNQSINISEPITIEHSVFDTKSFPLKHTFYYCPHGTPGFVDKLFSHSMIQETGFIHKNWMIQYRDLMLK